MSTYPSSPSSSPSSSLDEEAVDALQVVLAAEHAALWVYGLAVAFLGPQQADQARADAEAHRDLRGAIEQTLADVGAPPVSAQPAYATPQPVTDAASAAAVAMVAETDALAAWRSILERTTDRGLRRAALTTMNEGTLRCARWRVVLGTPPAVPVFPGG